MPYEPEQRGDLCGADGFARHIGLGFEVGGDHDQPLRRASCPRDGEQRDDGVGQLDGIRPSAHIRPTMCVAVPPELVSPADNDQSQRERERKDRKSQR